MTKLAGLILILFITLEANASCSFGPRFSAFSSVSPKKTSASKMAHRAITTDLYHGIVVEGRIFGESNGYNAIYIVTVHNPRTGRYRKALFKPRRPGDGGGWNRVTMEYFAYELALKLGIDRVPPVAYRKKENGNPITINGHTFHEGALLYLVPNAKSLHITARNEWARPELNSSLHQELFLSDARVLDVLLQNPDRHMKNFMRGTHWVDGKTLPFLIDHGASLKPETNLTIKDRGPYGVQGITVFRKSTVQHLQNLSVSNLMRHKEFISLSEAKKIIERRDEIISEIQTLSQLRGESEVIKDIKPLYFR